MSYHTEDWEYYLAKAYKQFEESNNDDNLYRKLHKMSEGMMNLCEHLNVVQKEYLNSIKGSDSDE